MLLGIPRSARCVQRFDDSLNSAIHITFRTFAASFIDAKAKRSVVESCNCYRPLRRASKDMRVRQAVVYVTEEGAPRPDDPRRGRTSNGSEREALAIGAQGVSVEIRNGDAHMPPSRGASIQPP